VTDKGCRDRALLDEPPRVHEVEKDLLEAVIAVQEG